MPNIHRTPAIVVLLVIASALMLSACGGGGGDGGVDKKDADQDVGAPQDDGQVGASQAILGPLAGAEIKAYRVDNLTNPIEGPITANSSLTDSGAAGTFDLDLTDVADNEWILVTASGGRDIDADDDGVIDSNPTNNEGTIHALAKASDWRRGANVNLLTEVAYQAVKDAPMDALDSALQFATTGLLGSDINSDGTLDYKDLIAFSPYGPDHKDASVLEYSILVESLVSQIHSAASTSALTETIDSLFGDSIKRLEKVKLVDFSPEVSVPSNSRGLTASDAVVSSFVGDGDTIIDGDGGSLLIAEDQQGRSLLLGYAVPETVAIAASQNATAYGTSPQQSTVSASEASAANMMNAASTELSPRSTALALVMMSISVSGEAASTPIAASVLADPEFAELELLLEDAFSNDPYFLDSLAYYTAIRSLVSEIAERAFQDYLDNFLEQRVAPQHNSAGNSYPLRRLAPSTELTAQNTFGKTFWSRLSPWNKDEPWDWFGETSALNVIEAPFPAVSVSQPGIYASANPTMLNYVLEMYDENGNKLAGPTGRDWFLIGRNSTVIQRTKNSFAAQTIHSNDGIFVRRPAHIEYNKYWLKIGDPAPTTIARALNVLHITTGVLNIVADAEFIATYVKRTTKALSQPQKMKDLVDNIRDCGLGLASSVDYTSDSLVAWVKDNGLSILETSVNGCALPLIEFYGTGALKDAANRAFASAFPKIAAKFSNPAGWAVIVFDAANDLAPFSTSLFLADAVVGYDLQWNTDGQLVGATRNDKRPNAPLEPQAKINVVSIDGLNVTLSAAGSEFDESANPGFEWGVGDGSVKSGETITHTYQSAGIKDIRLTLYDGLSDSSDAFTEVELTQGQPPIIQSMACSVGEGVVDARVQIKDTDDNNQVTVDWYPSATEMNSGPVLSGITDSSGAAVATLNYSYSAEQYYPVVKATDANGNQAIESCATRLGYQAPSDSVESSYPLTVRSNNSATLTSVPAGINCGPDCTASFNAGTIVTVSFDINEPNHNDTRFGEWDGDCGGSSNTCTVIMNGPRSVGASFSASGGGGLSFRAISLNDTGILGCSSGHDGCYGRDAASEEGTLSKVGAGAAGFDFTKLDFKGDSLPPDSPVWSCVRDNHTGLVWEVKTIGGGLHDKDNSYSWYDPESTGIDGIEGFQNGGSCNASSCDTDGFVSAVNVERLCGYDDWRVPTRNELVNIIHSGRLRPAIDRAYFPNTQSDYYWSYSSRADDTRAAWSVRFGRGRDYPRLKTQSHRIRLVRSAK